MLVSYWATATIMVTVRRTMMTTTATPSPSTTLSTTRRPGWRTPPPPSSATRRMCSSRTWSWTRTRMTDNRDWATSTLISFLSVDLYFQEYFRFHYKYNIWQNIFNNLGHCDLEWLLTIWSQKAIKLLYKPIDFLLHIYQQIRIQTHKNIHMIMIIIYW